MGKSHKADTEVKYKSMQWVEYDYKPGSSVLQHPV